MTSLEGLPGEAEAYDYINTVTAFNLAYFSEQLVSEAMHGAYDLRTRTVFVAAVGASALWKYDQYHYSLQAPPYGMIARSAIASLNSLELIASCDNEMPFWQTDADWDKGVRQAFRSIRFTQKGNRRPEFSAVGCTVLLEHYHQGRSYVRLPENMKG